MKKLKASDFFPISQIGNDGQMFHFPFAAKHQHLKWASESLPFSGNLIRKDGKLHAGSSHDDGSETDFECLGTPQKRPFQTLCAVNVRAFESLNEATYVNDDIINFWMIW